METLTCERCGAENRGDAIACFHCQAPLSRTGGAGARPGRSKRAGVRGLRGVRLDRAFLLSWLGATALLVAFAVIRKPSAGLWADLLGSATVALLLTVAFQIPYLGGFGDLSLGGVSALASLSAQRLFNQGVLASILSGLVVGFVFGLGLAVLGVRSRKKAWWITGFVGLLALVATCAWELFVAQPSLHPDLSLPGEMTGPLSVLIPALIALVGLYVFIFESAIGARVRSAVPRFDDAEGEKTIRAMFLVSGVISGFTGACAGALLAKAGLSHAAMFLLSPLALVFLSGSSLNGRLLRLENLAPASLIFFGGVYLIGNPGWTVTVGGAANLWRRSSHALPLADALTGAGFGVILTAILVFRDKILMQVPFAEDLTEETSSRRKSPRERTRVPRDAMTKPQLPPQLLLGLTAALLLGVGIIASSAILHSGASNAAVIRGLTGAVEKTVSGTSSWKKAARGDLLFAGDSLRTGEKSFVLLRLPGRHAARVDANTTVALDDLSDPVQNRHRTALRFSVGKLFADVTEKTTPSTDRAFEVKTPTATAAVRGTQFSTETSPGKAVITVNRGSVQVTRQKEAVTVSAGQRCVVTPQTGVQSPTSMTPQETAEWKQRSKELHLIWSANLSRTARNLLIGLLALMIVIGIVAEMIYGESRVDY